MRVAAVQMSSQPDREANLAAASALVDEAAAGGAELVVLPEMFNRLGSGSVLRQGAEPGSGPTLDWAAETARRHQVWLVAGSFIEAGGDGRGLPDRAPGTRGGVEGPRFNTSCLVSPAGEVTAAYRKVHLFDCAVTGAEFHESSVTRPGHELVVAPAGAVQVGFTICYDLRFPEQFRALAVAGADVIVVPAAFTARTGPPHWEILLRARAIEDQVFVIAAAQAGRSAGGGQGGPLSWHGHSMIIDPWGRILAEVAEPAPGVILADLDLAERDRIRATLPSLASRRPDVYG